jgi:hypothetical protein
MIELMVLPIGGHHPFVEWKNFSHWLTPILAEAFRAVNGKCGAIAHLGKTRGQSESTGTLILPRAKLYPIKL